MPAPSNRFGFWIADRLTMLIPAEAVPAASVVMIVRVVVVLMVLPDAGGL